MTAITALTASEYMRQRGVDKAAKSLGWYTEGAYLVYPLLDPATGEAWVTPDGDPALRFVRWDKTHKGPRFFFKPAIPDNWSGPRYLPDMYVPGDVWTEAKKRYNTVRIVCGEMDLLTMRAINGKNCITFYGEQNIPDNLPGFLMAQGITSVNYYPDNDKTGLLAAAKMQVIFGGLKGIKLSIYALPDTGPNGESVKDINDLWIALNHETASMQAALASCRELSVTDIWLPFADWIVNEDKAALGAVRSMNGKLDLFRLSCPEFDEIWAMIAPVVRPQQEMRLDAEADNTPPPDLWAAIEGAARVSQYGRDNWSKPVSCPSAKHEHDDSDPAFSLNRAKFIGKCLKCGVVLGWMELSRIYNIDHRPYFQSAPTRSAAAPVVPIGSGSPPAAEVPAGPIVLVSSAEAFERARLRAQEWADDPRDIRGLRMNLHPKMDLECQGMLPKNDVWLILAKTGVGKSTAVMQAGVMLSTQAPGAMLSPENALETFIDRIIAHAGGFSTRAIMSGKTPDLTALMNEYHRAPTRYPMMFLEPSAGNSSTMYIEDVLALLPRLQAEGVKWLSVDSINNLKSREHKDLFPGTEAVIRGLEYISKTLGPVIATCQANRGPSDRSNKTPIPADAQGGGVIEQGCTRIAVFHRPAYDYETGELKQSPVSDPDYAFFRIVKDRHTAMLGRIYPVSFYRGKLVNEGPNRGRYLYRIEPRNEALEVGSAN